MQLAFDFEALAQGRVIDLFAGPGGWDEGARIAGIPIDIEGFDFSRDACATARAAGFKRECVDVATLSMSDFGDVRGAIMSPPCPTFSVAGKRSGDRDYQKVLDVWTAIGWGVAVDDALADLAHVEDKRTAMLAHAGVWAMCLPALEWVALEQVPSVAFAWEDLAAELYSQGWEWVDVLTLDALEFGVPSRRKRSFLVGRKFLPCDGVPAESRAASMAGALGWPAGHRVNTRGARRTSGGNEFSADGQSWCLTGSTRSWKRDDGHVLSPSDAGVLVGFRPDYPWQGSRSSAFLQAADVVSPPVAAAVLGTIFETKEPGLRLA